MWKSSTTTAFSNDPPRARPARWSFSTSRLKPNVRARAISFWNERPSSSTVYVWSLMSGCWKSIVYVTRKRRAGRSFASLSPSETTIGFFTCRNLRGERSSWMPARWMSCTNGAPEPSPIGTSGPSTSMRAVSMPQPTSAARRCSTVPMRTSPRPSDVLRTVSTTALESAGISIPGATSVRTNEIPLSAGAGASVSRTRSPVWRPTPS